MQWLEVATKVIITQAGVISQFFVVKHAYFTILHQRM